MMWRFWSEVRFGLGGLFDSKAITKGIIFVIINKVIVHELKKEQHGAIQPSVFRPLVLDGEDEIVVKLVEDINKIYGGRYNGAHYGTFADGEGRGAFPDDLENYSKLDNPSDLNFIKVSHVAMMRLYDKASSSPLSSGGYILLCDYILGGTRFFLVVMIKKTKGMRISKDLKPEELEQLDLSKLHQAAKINFRRLSEYESADNEARKEINYLSFISPSSSKSTSGYFVKALGCSEGNTSNNATDNLIKSSRKFFKGDERISANKDVFMSQVFTYLYEKLGTKEPVRLSEVANIAARNIPAELGEESTEIVNAYVSLLNSDELSIPTEFPVSKTILNKQTHVTAKTENWKFVFDKVALGTDPAAEIFYNRDQETLSITRLPPEIVEQLNKELDQDDQEEDDDDGA